MDKSITDEETFLFIYKNVCLENNIPYTDEDITDDNITGENYKIIYLINKMLMKIVILTNRQIFPKELKYLVVEMVNEDYSIIKSDTDPEYNQGIQSMSEAGRSVSFGSSDTWKAKYNLLMTQQLKDREQQINKFKLLYKVGCPYAKD